MQLLLIFPQPSITVQFIIDIPELKVPLALFPVPVRVVDPVIWKVISNVPLQLSDVLNNGMI